MPDSSPKSSFASKLPHQGMTIFTVMSALAKAHGAVNLGQGFPDFACDPQLVRCVTDAMEAGHNQYPLMAGVPALRDAISAKIEALYGYAYDAENEITVTAGATQGIFTAIAACLRPGDEVIVLEPAYDSYIPAIMLAGGIVKALPLAKRCDPAGNIIGFDIPFEALAAALGPRTRLLILNTPHNPTGSVWSARDMAQLAMLLSGTNALVCSDEVYEHILFDGLRHESVARHPALAARSFLVSSFGKTYHVTGWKTGYVAAPAWLTAEFRKVHQFNVFTANAPMQHGIAAYMQQAEHYHALAEFYQEKRDYFRAGVEGTGLRLLPCDGTYFQCADYSGLGLPEAKLPEREFAEWLTRAIGVTAIPLCAFRSTPFESSIIRFCFAKERRTLDEALGRLGRL